MSRFTYSRVLDCFDNSEVYAAIEIRLAQNYFLWRSQNLFKFTGVSLYNATLESPDLFHQSDVLLIWQNIFPAIFSAYTVLRAF